MNRALLYEERGDYDLAAADFTHAIEDDLHALENRGLLFRLKCRSAALLSPTQ